MNAICINNNRKEYSSWHPTLKPDLTSHADSVIEQQWRLLMIKIKVFMLKDK